VGLPDILDQIAIKARSITGIAGASGAGVTAGVAGNPGLEMPETPYAIVWLDAGSVTQGGTLSTFDEHAEIRVYVAFSSLPAGYAFLVGLPDLFEAAWVTDRDLGGTCLDSGMDGYGKVARESWGPADYLVMSIRIGFLRLAAHDFSS
jgi:hypothetical protein